MVEERYDSSRIEQDEIDLYEVILVLKRRSSLILSIFLIATIAIGIISFIMTPVYKSSFVIKGPFTFYGNNQEAPIISPDVSGKLIKELDEAVKEERITAVSNLLKISADNAIKIFSLETSVLGNFIELVIEIEDPTLIISIKDGIMGYLNRNQYVSERVTLTRTNLIQRKQGIQAKITEIDEFKNILTDQIKSGKMATLGFNPMVIERDVMNLRQELNDIDLSIQLLRGFEVVAEPYIPEKPAKPKKILITAAAGISSLFFGVLLAFFMEWYEKSRKRVNKTIS